MFWYFWGKGCAALHVRRSEVERLWESEVCCSSAVLYWSRLGVDTLLGEGKVRSRALGGEWGYCTGICVSLREDDR